MKKKTILKIIFIAVLFVVCNLNVVHATTGTRYLGLRNLSGERETGEYTFNNKSIFKIVDYNSTGSAWSDEATIYCLKAGPGFGSTDYENRVVTYTQFFDIKSPNRIETPYREQLPSDMTTYNELVWVLDHIYNSKVETIDEYLARVGILESSKFRNGTIPENEIKDIIESIEQVAIWYFTNPDGEYHNSFTDRVVIYVEDENGKKELGSKYGLDYVDGEIDTIYEYLVKGAIDAVSAGYTYETNTPQPVKFTFDESQVRATAEGNNYVIGPFRFEKNNDTPYTLTAEVIDGENTVQNVIILDSQKQEITQGNTLGEKINSTVGSNFYISIPIAENLDITKVQLETEVVANIVTPIMWTVGANSLGFNQPVVAIDNVTKTYTAGIKIEVPKINGEYKFKLTKEDSDNNDKLSEVNFEITINGNAVDYTTDKNGEITIEGINITDLQSDEIRIKEKSTKPGYILNDNEITLIVNKSIGNGKLVASNVTGSSNAQVTTSPDGINTLEINVENTKKTGSYRFKLIKEGASSGGKLEGVKFNVSVNGSEKEYATNSNGEILIDNIQITNAESDTITIRETETLEGYILNEEPITLTVNKTENADKYVANNVTGSSNAQVTTSPDGINTVEINVENTKKTGSYRVKLIKEDASSGRKLEGVKFNVSVNGNEKEYTTNSNGEILIDNIQITNAESDTITIRETETLEGYILNGDLVTLTVSKIENADKYVASNVTGSSNAKVTTSTDGINTVEINVENTKKTGSYSFKLIKEDASSGEKLEGVKFNVSVNGNEKEYATNSNGEILIDNIQITNTKNDTITIRETETLEGYILNEEPITLTVSKTENVDKYVASNVTGSSNAKVITSSDGINTVEINVENTKKIGSYKLKIIKQDSDNENIKLEGVKFNVSVNGREKEYATNSNGEILIDNIQITNTESDTITIKEISTLNGYILNTNPIIITVQKTELEDGYVAESASMTKEPNSEDKVTMIENSGENIVQVTLNNTKISGEYGLKIIKEDSINKTEKLNGVEFEITINNGQTEVYTTDNNGEILINSIPIINNISDTILIKEKNTINGYILDENPITLTIQKNISNNKYTVTQVIGYNNAKITQGQDGKNIVEINIENTKKTGSYRFKLIKEDASSGEKLEGVKFNVSVNGNEKEYTTNSNGEILIDNIQITNTENDTITIRETETLEGYILNEEPITLTVSKIENADKYVASNVTGSSNVTLTTDNTGVNTVNLTVNNTKISGSYKLKVIKQDSSNSQKLEGAEFNISINGGQETKYTTNENGEITIDSIQINQITTVDIIRITEIKSPEGYVLDSTPIDIRVIKDEENGKYVASNVEGNENVEIIKDGSGVNTVQIKINNTKISGKYNIKIIKEDMLTHETLGGAIFAVKVNNEEETEVETDAKGEINIEDIAITEIDTQDRITIREIKAPDEYSSFNETITLTVNKTESNGEYTVDDVKGTIEDGTEYEDIKIVNDSGELTVQVTVPNEKIEGSYNLKIIKQDDQDSNKKLQGAVFRVESKELIEETATNKEYTTDSKGEINITGAINNNNNIKITIEEVEAPTGYESILEGSIDLVIIPTIKEEKYVIGDVSAVTGDTNWRFEEETNTIIVTIENKKQPFDLALRKYITQINGEEVKISREPEIGEEEKTKLEKGEASFDEGTTAEKNHTKTALRVQTGDKVIYTIRIYNEGKIDGYAKEITDYLPEGLELVPAAESSINAEYGWIQEGRTVKTTYLTNTIIKGISNENREISLDYKDVQIECEVVKKASNTNISLKNVAEITEAEDIIGGKEDIDSVPNNLSDEEKNNYNPGTSEEGKGYEDDDDYEELVMEPTYFDLSLRKFITGINDREITNREPEVDVSPLISGETTAKYNHTKEPIEVKKGDEIIYTIRVYNEGQVDGYVEKIVDHLPEELEFLPNDEINIKYGWKQTDERTIETDYLRNTLLTAFDGENNLDYADIQIKCRVRDSAEYLKEITNIAEITEYRNDLDLKDRDNEKEAEIPSDEELPNYKKEEINSGIEYIPGQEDDDDFEKVILEKFDLALRKEM